MHQPIRQPQSSDKLSVSEIDHASASAPVSAPSRPRPSFQRLLAGLMAVSAVVVICFAGACEARASGNKFTIDVAPTEVKAGGEATALVEFKPGPNLKWNHEYPARLTIQGDADNVDLEKLSFRKNDFKATDEKATLEVPLKGKVAGSDVIEAEARFSVCNDTTCLIERVPVQIPVDVVP